MLILPPNSSQPSSSLTTLFSLQEDYSFGVQVGVAVGMRLLNGSSPHLKGHAGLLDKVRRLFFHSVLDLLELVKTQHMEVSGCTSAFLLY